MVDMLGKLVIKVLCDGCMAEDHKIKKVGRVVAIKKAHEVWPKSYVDDRYEYAECLILNSHLDAEKEFFYVCIQDSSLQQSRFDMTVYFHYV